MDNEELKTTQTPSENSYTPRPLWQRILAWIGLGLFVAFIVMYYIHILRGGR